MTRWARRAHALCDRLGCAVPLLEAPMAGACSPALAAAVVRAGGMGAMGCLLSSADEIAAWVRAYRALGGGPLQLNTWIPGPAPRRDPGLEERQRQFLARFGPAVPPVEAGALRQDFEGQCEAMLAARPAVISSIMGLFPPLYVERVKAAGILWLATVTALAEAEAAEAAGADALIVQGIEAGGHRGTFDADAAEHSGAGLMALLPLIADRTKVPLIAAGGIADGRGAAAAFLLGASAVQIGTAFLRCEEAEIPKPWSDRLAELPPDGTRLTRAFSGRPGRAINTAFVRAASATAAPPPAPYPVQRALTARMRAEAARKGDIEHMQAWAGQGAGLARPGPAGALVERIWAEAKLLLGGDPARADRS